MALVAPTIPLVTMKCNCISITIWLAMKEKSEMRADRLKAIRVKSGYTQEALASDSGLNASNMQITHELQRLKAVIEQQGRLLRLQTSQSQLPTSGEEQISPSNIP